MEKANVIYAAEGWNLFVFSCGVSKSDWSEIQSSSIYKRFFYIYIYIYIFVLYQFVLQSHIKSNLQLPPLNRASKMSVFSAPRSLLRGTRSSSLFADMCVYAYSMSIRACVLIICMHVCVRNRYKPASWTPSSISWRHHSTSGAGLHSVTQGDTWRGSPLPVAYGGDHRPVTVCHSGFVPRHAPTLAGLGRRVGAVMSADRLTGDRWSQPDSGCHRQSNLHTFPTVLQCVCVCVCVCVSVCASIQTHTAALFNTSGMGLQGHSGVEQTPSETFCVTS